MYRTIIEMSCMINNDEWFIYSDKEVKSIEEVIGKIDYVVTGFDDPTLRFSRPIFDIELAEGLGPFARYAYISPEGFWYSGRAEDERLPEISLLLDSYYRMKKWFNFRAEYCNGTISSWIANYVGSNYYDCMSGGMSKYDISIIKYFCETEDVNMQEAVYPGIGEGKWYTLQDFVDSTIAPNFQELLNKYKIALDGSEIKQLKE